MIIQMTMLLHSALCLVIAINIINILVLIALLPEVKQKRLRMSQLSGHLTRLSAQPKLLLYYHALLWTTMLSEHCSPILCFVGNVHSFWTIFKLHCIPFNAIECRASWCRATEFSRVARLTWVAVLVCIALPTLP